MGKIAPTRLNEKWCWGCEDFLPNQEFKPVRTRRGSIRLCGKCRSCTNKVESHRRACRRVERGLPPVRPKHGLSNTSEWRAWWSAIERCENPNAKHYNIYGGRGITMCKEWRNSFMAFYQYVGPKPDADRSIDRIDNNGNYEPGNVRWATKEQQSNNRRIWAPKRHAHKKALRKFLQEFREIHTGPPTITNLWYTEYYGNNRLNRVTKRVH